MKNKKIIFIGILFILFITIGTLNVNASTEVNSVNDLVNILGKKNVEVNEEQIKLLNDIDLKDNLIIKDGKYIIDMNGKSISYTKNYEVIFYMHGGNLTIKDETNKGELISNCETISCYNGFLKIENCKVTNKEPGTSSIYISNDALVQIDDGVISDTVVISGGSLIINGGLFKNGLEVNFEPFTYEQPIVIINDGKFTGKHAGLYIWFSYYAKNVQLKGGTFEGKEKQTPGIYVGGDKFSLKNLLAPGYKFDNNEEHIKEVQYVDDVSYHTTSANKVSVEKYSANNNIIKLIFIDYDGNIIETKDIKEGSNFTLPEAPEKEGYVFVGWNVEPEKVTKDMVVTPIYEKLYNFEIDVIYDEYYTGKEIKPNVVIIDESTNKRLAVDDYEITCENNINVGTVDFVVQGKGKYKYCTQEGNFKIMPRNIYYNCKIDYENNFEYTGEEIKPNIELSFGNINLTKDIDYNVTYESNINTGVGKINIVGIGNYTGEKTECFKINKKEIDEVILKETDIIYTGEKIFPEVVVKSQNKELVENTDYTIYYSNNINVGTATIRINGIGNYSGYITKEFNIISKNIEDTEIKEEDKIEDEIIEVEKEDKPESFVNKIINTIINLIKNLINNIFKI